MDGLQALALDEILESLSPEQWSHDFIFLLKIQHIFFMAQSSIFYLPELLEQILHFLAIDKSLYLALFIC